MRTVMLLFVVVLIVAWFKLGHPVRTLTDLGWGTDAAPWETVDALYYPNRGDRLHHQTQPGFHNLAECRAAVNGMARAAGDITLRRGDYSCGVGLIADAGGEFYRLTLQ